MALCAAIGVRVSRARLMVEAIPIDGVIGVAVAVLAGRGEAIVEIWSVAVGAAGDERSFVAWLVVGETVLDDRVVQRRRAVYVIIGVPILDVALIA